MSTTKAGSTSFAAKLATGGVAGMLGTTAIFPVDVCKTRMQSGMIAADVGFVTAFRTILRTEGAFAFYRGIGANLVGVFPEKGIKLAANDGFRRLAGGTAAGAGDLPIVTQIGCGACAAACQVTVTTPMELVKMQCQVQSGHASPVDVLRRLGVSGLFKGFGATLAREIPFGAIVLPLYPVVLAKISVGDATPKTHCYLAAGVVSGATAAAATCPLDVVKTRLQLGGRDAAAVCRQVLAEDGPRGFFRGVGPRVSIFAGLYGVLFLSYECANTLLGI